MNEHEFEKQLRAEGYTEIESQNLAPRPGKGRHRHHFAIQGLVLSGAFIVQMDGEPAHSPQVRYLLLPRENCTTNGLDRRAPMSSWAASSPSLIVPRRNEDRPAPKRSAMDRGR